MAPKITTPTAASLVALPAEYAGLRAALEVEALPPEHVFAGCLTHGQQHGRQLLAWFDARYTSVFASERIEWEGDRRDELARKLRSPESFLSADAEVQTAAMLLSHQTTRLVAQAEGEREGERRADLLLVAPTLVEVEVRLLQEEEADRKTQVIEDSINKRLAGVVARTGQDVSVVLRVRRAYDDQKRLLLEPRMERALANEVQRVLTIHAPLDTSALVALYPDGSAAQYNGTRGLYGALAEVELRPSPQRLRMTFSGLSAVAGESEARRALKKKLDRKQRTGENAWMVVLDRSGAWFLGDDEVQAGVRSLFKNTRSLSAVTIQQRRFWTPGLGLSPSDIYKATFESMAIANPNAKYPLAEHVLQLFST